VLAVLVLGILGLAYAYMAHQRVTLINSDFFSFARRMDRLGTTPWQETWVDGLYPVGYPYLVKFVAGYVGGYAPAARLISAFSGWIGLVALWVLAYRTGGRVLAAGTVLLTGLNHWYLTFATSEGTDMPAAGLLLVALAIASTPSLRRPHLLALGAVLGAAYLVRYTALLALPALALVWAVEDRLHWKPLLRKLVWVGLAFAIVSAPQWIASWLVRGTPLYNTQHWNIWYAIEGEGKWWRILTVGPTLPNLGAVIAKVGFGAFLKNFALNVYRLVALNMFGYPAYLLWLVGAGMVLGLRSRAGMLLLAMGVVFGGAISLAFLSPRVLLPLLPLQVCLSLVPVRWALHRWPTWSTSVLLPALSVAVVLYGWYVYEYTLGIIHTPYESAQTRLPDVLRKAGMKRVDEVLSFSHNLYDVPSPVCARFATPWLGSAVPIRSEAEVLWMAVHGGQRFVVFDGLSSADVDGLDRWYAHRHLAPPLEPVMKEETVEAYALPDSVIARFRPATGADWTAFAATHYPALGKLWPTDAALLQEEKPAPGLMQGTPTPLLLSDWRRYKGEHRLK